MASEIISVKNVFKTYGDLKALKGLSFTVQPSTCLSLLGPNGAGKTTMMKILYAKATRDKNPGSEVSVFGFDPAKNELDIKSRSGVVPQDNNLDEELNVEENLQLYCKFYGIGKKEGQARIDYLLDFMDLDAKKGVKIRELSGGMKRRLIIARALLNEPELLILDEPTTGLDPQVRQVIWDKLRILKKQGTTILLTTHYMDEAFQLADTIIIMDKGEKIVEGNPKALLQEHIEDFVLEVHDKDSVKSPENVKDNGDMRCEITEDRFYCYSNSIDELKKLAGSIGLEDYYVRQSNLEDLFLKVTGRGLNEIQ